MKRVSRYLIISKKNNSNRIIHPSIEELLKSMHKSTGLIYGDNSIKLNGVSFECQFKVINAEIQKEDRKFFILVLELNDESEVENFEEVDDEIFNFIDTYNDLEIIVLEDAISQFYSKQAYELIHIIENKTRSLISEVMFLKSGKEDWERKLTKSLAIRDNNKKIGKNYKSLDGKYFSDLTTILFSIYEEKDKEEDSGQETFENSLKYLDQLISKCDNSNENLGEIIISMRNAVEGIKDSAPRSVWNRYIAPSLMNSDKLINSIGTVLKQLEKPRNDIAHNTIFRKKDYDLLKSNVDKIYVQLSDAIASFEDTYIKKYPEATIATFEDTYISKDTEDVMLENGIAEKGDDLTLIVPAQEDGFKRVFLKKHEWYDIRIGKARRNKIQYIAGYEVSPRSGIQYVAKVDKIVPSDNYVGYWKVVFDGPPQKYERLIPLGNTYPPQNIRYTTKKELDSVAERNETLVDIFNNPY